MKSVSVDAQLDKNVKQDVEMREGTYGRVTRCFNSVLVGFEDVNCQGIRRSEASFTIFSALKKITCITKKAASSHPVC